MTKSHLHSQLYQIHAFLGRALSLLWHFLCSPYLSYGLFLACALTFMLGLAFPQLPGTLAEPARRVLLSEALRGRLPEKIPALWSLWLRFLGAMLLLNLLLGLFERGEILWRSLRSPEIHPPIEGGLRQSFSLAEPPERAVQGLRDSLPRPLCRLLVTENRGEIYLYADRFGLPDLGLFLLHLGLVLAIGVAFCEARLGWHEEGARLVPGEVYYLEHDSALGFRLERFEGDESGGVAQITILKEGKELKQATLRAGHPFFYRGLGFYLTASGPFLQVRGENDEGKALLLQPLVKEAARQEEIKLFFSQVGDERYFSVPSPNLTFQVVFRPEMGFAVRAFRPNEARPIVSETFGQAETFKIELERGRYFLEAGRYAVFHLAWEPGLLPLSGAGGLVVLGLTLYLAFRQVRFWGTVRTQGAGSVLELRIEENRLAFGKSFSAWVERRL